MTTFFLIAVMIWHDEGSTNNTRKAVVPIDSGALCEAVADRLRDDWRKEVPGATISVECVPVIKWVRA